MPSKLLFLQNLIDFDSDSNSNYRLLFHSRELTPGSNIDAVKLLGLAIAFWVRYMGLAVLVRRDGVLSKINSILAIVLVI